jgi:hypothetical protein
VITPRVRVTAFRGAHWSAGRAKMRPIEVPDLSQGPSVFIL